MGTVAPALCAPVCHHSSPALEKRRGADLLSPHSCFLAQALPLARVSPSLSEHKAQAVSQLWDQRLPDPLPLWAPLAQQAQCTSAPGFGLHGLSAAYPCAASEVQGRICWRYVETTGRTEQEAVALGMPTVCQALLWRGFPCRGVCWGWDSCVEEMGGLLGGDVSKVWVGAGHTAARRCRPALRGGCVHHLWCAGQPLGPPGQRNPGLGGHEPGIHPSCRLHSHL